MRPPSKKWKDITSQYVYTYVGTYMMFFVTRVGRPDRTVQLWYPESFHFYVRMYVCTNVYTYICIGVYICTNKLATKKYVEKSDKICRDKFAILGKMRRSYPLFDSRSIIIYVTIYAISFMISAFTNG